MSMCFFKRFFGGSRRETMQGSENPEKTRFGGRFLEHLGRGLLVLAVIAVFAALFMVIWNAMMPLLFKLPVLGFWQSAGLLILSRILFGGFGTHIAGGASHHRRGAFRAMPYHGENELRRKWMDMSDEERQAFAEKMRSFHRQFSRDDERGRGDGEPDGK